MNRDAFLNTLMSSVPATAIPRPTRQPVVLTPVAPSKPEPELDPEDQLMPLPLGYDKGVFFYLSRLTMQIHDLTAGMHTPSVLMSMAPQSVWYKKFPHTKTGIDWQAAMDFLFAACHAIGVYNHERLRGRGVTFDQGRVVLHLGDRLIVDGIPQTSLSIPGSKHIYEKSKTLELSLGQPLSDAEAYKIIEICNMFSWSSSDMGLLFAGWLVTAPVCGGLPWRTHLWLTGERGSGKSWIMSNFVKPLTGELGFYVQSKTTEAGIRQHLRTDARPVIFDESETHNDQDRMRLQQVLDLARQASSDAGFEILKGTSNGKEMRFRIHSSFLFSSINFGAIQSADESRIIPLALVPLPPGEDSAAKFDSIKKFMLSFMSPEFSGKLLARTLNLLPVIRANIKTFSRALSEKLTSRQADTIGSVIAGVYSLYSSRELTYDEAKQFVENKKWIAATALRTETDADHTKAIAHFLEQIIRLTPSQEYSIGEAINLASSNADHEIHRTLGRYGLKTRDGEVFIARNHSILDGFFSHTPWAKVWDKTFLQSGLFSFTERVVDFAGVKKRALVVSLRQLLPE